MLTTKYSPSFTHLIRHYPIHPLGLVAGAPRIFLSPWHEAGQAAAQLRGLVRGRGLREWLRGAPDPLYHPLRGVHGPLPVSELLNREGRGRSRDFLAGSLDRLVAVV